MDEPMKPEKPESIRHWYQRTTRKARRALVWATACSGVMMGLMWAMASMPTLSRLQTFNGALTVPLVGGLWIFMFIFMFLIPTREASFRGQETLEGGVESLKEAADILKKFVDLKVGPTVEVWMRIGQQVEKEYPEIRRKIEESVFDLKTTAARVEKAVEDNAAFVSDAKPVLEALKRIEERIEEDLLDDVQDMVEAVKRMSGVPVAPPKPAPTAGASPEGKAALAPSLVEIPPDREPKLGSALSSIRKRKEKEAAEQPK